MRLVQFDIYFSHHFHIFMLNYIAYIIRYEIIMMQWLIVRFLLTVKIRQCCKFRCYTDSSIIAFVITMIELCCMLQVQKTLLARLPSPGLLPQDSGACLTAYIFVHSILPRHTVPKAINIQADGRCCCWKRDSSVVYFQAARQAKAPWSSWCADCKKGVSNSWSWRDCQWTQSNTKPRSRWWSKFEVAVGVEATAVCEFGRQ